MCFRFCRREGRYTKSTPGLALVDRLAESLQQLNHLLTKKTNMAETMSLKVDTESVSKSSILQNMLDATQLLINHNDPTMYVSTRAERVALRMLKRFNCIFIKGRSGTGKSRLGLNLLSQIAKERKCTPLVLCFSQDWKLIPKMKEKYVIMIDNIFGSSNLSASQEEKWKRQFEIMWPSVESGNVLLVITSRPEISAQCKTRIRKYTLMEKIPSIDLDEGELRLKPVEKMKFLRKYCRKRTELSKEQMEEISKIHTSLGFPQCCEFFAKNKYVQTKGVKFFERPHEFLKDIILSMKQGDPLGYFVLQLVMLQEGSLEHGLLTTLHVSQFTDLICELSSISYISSKPTRGAIKSKADSLCGVYLTRADKAYQFAHQSIFDAVFLDFAMEYPEMCLRNCLAQMLVELVRTGQQTDDQEVLLHLSDDLHDVLADRVVEILQSPSATEIWNHPSLFNESFIDLLMSKLDKNNLGYILSRVSDSIDEFSYEKHLIKHHDILSFAIVKRNESLAKAIVTKLENTHQEYNKSVALALAILMSLSDLIMVLLNRGINPTKECLQALCYSELLDDVITGILLEKVDVLSCSISHEEGTRLLAQASLNGNIAVAKMMMDVFIGRDKDSAYVSLAILFDLMLGKELQQSVIRKVEMIIKLLLSRDLEQYMLDNLVHDSCTHASAMALKAVLQQDVIYYPSNWMSHLERALEYGVVDLVEELLKKAVKDDMEEKLGKFLHLAADSVIDSGPKMNLLLQHFDNAISLVNNTQGTERTPLHAALTQGNTDVVKELVKGGVDVNFEDYSLRTLLHVAVTDDHEDLVKELLKAGADVNLNDYDETSPLLLAAENINIMKILVQAGSDVNHSDKFGLTTLHSVVRGNDLEAARFLCNKGSDVNHVDRDGHSVLHTACRFGDVDMIDFLCKNGATTTLDNDGASVLHYCVESEGDAVENAQYVMDILGVPVDVEDGSGRTALFTAVVKSDMELVEYLVEKGADLKHRDKEDNSLLHAVCKCMSHLHLEMIKFLCDAGIDPDLCNKSKRTVLHEALSNANNSLAPCIVFLAEKISDINQPDCDGATPLHLAASWYVYLELLLGLGAGKSITKTDNHGQTPLHRAACDNFCLTQLLDYGAGGSINQTDKAGQTPLHLAAKSGFIICMRQLLEHGADRSINQADNAGQTPLHLACTIGERRSQRILLGSDHYVGFLLENGAVGDINKTDSNGQSPLHLPARCGNYLSVKHLIEKGADRNIQDVTGSTPADITLNPSIRKFLNRTEDIGTAGSDSEDFEFLFEF